MINDNIRYIVFGVLFNHSFKTLDYWGEIVDDILYNNGYFDASYFTNISSQYTLDRELSNARTGNSLRLTSNQLIYRANVDKNFTTFYDDFCKKIEMYLVPNILKKYDLIIRRLGIVFAEKMTNQELQKFSAKYFKEDISGINDFRFSKKETSKQGRLWQGTNDYINKIYTVGTITGLEDFQGVSYDFQFHYNPVQRDVRDKIKVFLEEGLKNFENDITLGNK